MKFSLGESNYVRGEISKRKKN